MGVTERRGLRIKQHWDVARFHPIGAERHDDGKAVRRIASRSVGHLPP